jgi:dTDP-glucose pyrophosphorylase
LNLVVLCAGAGSRFKKESTTPKPFIEFKGKPLFYWAANSALNYFSIKSINFVFQSCHQDVANNQVLTFFPNARCLFLPNLTSGAAETAFIALSIIKNTDPIIFLDCDIFFKLTKKIELDFEGYEACCLTFQSNNKNYSYAKIHDNFALVTEEKKVISSNAITGCYIFKNKEIFLNAYKIYLRSCHYSELYLSGLFNILINNEMKVLNIPVQKNISLGTPEELKKAVSEDLV